jgi:hypothetical protein
MFGLMLVQNGWNCDCGFDGPVFVFWRYQIMITTEFLCQ